MTQIGGDFVQYAVLSAAQLIRECARSPDAAAWEEFVHRFHRLIAGVVLRTAQRWGETSREALDDLIQETYLKLCADQCRLLREFEFQSPDSILGYLKVITANVVHDHFKAVHADKRGSGWVRDDLSVTEARTNDASAGSAVSMERAVLFREIDACLRRQETGRDLQRNRLIFWLYYRAGLSARAIASLPSIGLSTEGVESAILRLTRLVRMKLAEGRAGKTTEQDQRLGKGVPRADSF